MKNDWADEIVEAWWDEPREKPNQELDEEDFERFKAREKAALRKAKADGMRECADWVEQIYGPDLANSFRETASKLSPT